MQAPSLAWLRTFFADLRPQHRHVREREWVGVGEGAYVCVREGEREEREREREEVHTHTHTLSYTQSLMPCMQIGIDDRLSPAFKEQKLTAAKALAKDGPPQKCRSFLK